MAGIPGYRNRLIADGKEITGFLSNLVLRQSREQIDDSVLDEDKAFISGQAMRNVIASGRWTGDTDELDDVIASSIGSEDSYVAARFGKLVWKQGTVIAVTHEVDASNSSRVGVAAGWQFDRNDFFSGWELTELSFTAPATKNGSVVDLGAAKASKTRKVLVYFLNASATSPAGSVEISTSATKSGRYTTVGSADTFTSAEVTSAITAGKPLELSITGALSRYVKGKVTTIGANTTAEVLVVADLT